MNSFSDALIDWLDRTKESDRYANIAQAIYVDLKSTTIRLWGGVGQLIDTNGDEWVGWMSPDGDSFIESPNVSDIRDGASTLLPITVGYLDEETYLKMRDDEEETDGRLLILYKAFLEEGVTRLQVPMGDAHRYRIKRTSFKQGFVRSETGLIKRYSMTVHVKNVNEGRSRSFFGTYTSTGQRAMSELFFGVQDDGYADFTPKYASGYTINLDA